MKKKNTVICYMLIIIFIVFILLFIIYSIFHLFFKKEVSKKNNDLLSNKLFNIKKIHEGKQLAHGNLNDELPEQIMAYLYINPSDKVLELGGNLGINSIIINSLLYKKNKHVVVEPLKNIIPKLLENKNLNKSQFEICNFAISDSPLVQKEWVSKKILSIDDKEPGWEIIPTITWKNFKQKYKIKFNTLVADCEGCLVPILENNPEILKKINKILIEHDFRNEDQYYNFLKIMKNNGFCKIDEMKKGEKYCPGLDWPDGISIDPVFVSYWRKPFPITFSIPAEKIIYSIPIKKKILSIIRPGNAYSFDEEYEYYKEYQDSLFAITTKKGGWDCLRHYEILANGAIPYFPDFEHCPLDTMFIFPKKLIFEGNRLYEKIKNYTFIEQIPKYLINTCYNLIEKLLTYTKNNLSTVKTAEYILKKIEKKNVKNILYLRGKQYPDYLSDLTLHGFKSLFKSKCHEYPKNTFIYKSNTREKKNMYGMGFSYSELLDDFFYDNSKNNIKDIQTDILNHVFDIIIYGSIYDNTESLIINLPLYDFVSTHYSHSDVILLCGDDENTLKNNQIEDFIKKKNVVFLRECSYDKL